MLFYLAQTLRNNMSKKTLINLLKYQNCVSIYAKIFSVVLRIKTIYTAKICGANKNICAKLKHNVAKWLKFSAAKN